MALDEELNTNFGKILKSRREKKKLKISDVCDELFIKERQIEALEAEDFDNLPQYTFTRGFALKYAQYLELDVEEIAKKFDATFPQNKRCDSLSDIKAPLKSMGTLHRDDRKSLSINPLLVFGVIGVFVLGVFFVRVVTNAEQENNSTQTTEETVNIEEQQQGASIGSTSDSGVGSTGSAINIDE